MRASLELPATDLGRFDRDDADVAHASAAQPVDRVHREVVDVRPEIDEPTPTTSPAGGPERLLLQARAGGVIACDMEPLLAA